MQQKDTAVGVFTAVSSCIEADHTYIVRYANFRPRLVVRTSCGALMSHQT